MLREGKAHLRRAVIRHEEALRVHSLCKILRKMDILQDVLSLTHKRSLEKYSELDREDDFDETAEAPEIQCEPPLMLQQHRHHQQTASRINVIALHSWFHSSNSSETRHHSDQLLHSSSYRHLPETGE